MVHNICKEFINRPDNSYKPIGCRPVVIKNVELQLSGQANRNELFFFTKANTIREVATLDLILTHPDWLRQAILRT